VIIKVTPHPADFLLTASSLELTAAYSQINNIAVDL
jgi:hypothetical protein